jgi:hypothetical protein
MRAARLWLGGDTGPPIDGGFADGALDAPVSTDTPLDGPHVVFVTSTTISGGMSPLGGLAGADAFCQIRARRCHRLRQLDQRRRGRYRPLPIYCIEQ